MERELSKTICVSLIQHLQKHPNCSIDVLTVDMKKLRSWFLSNKEISNKEILESAMGYNNFCLDIVSTAAFTTCE